MDVLQDASASCAGDWPSVEVGLRGGWRAGMGIASLVLGLSGCPWRALRLGWRGAYTWPSARLGEAAGTRCVCVQE